MTSSNYTYQAGGCLPANAPTYVRRQADEDLFAGIKAGEFCYVLNSRQMGKSSLRVQTMQRLQEEGFACVEIDMTSIGSQNLTADQWYASIVRNLVSGFKLSDRFNLRTWWRDRDLISSVQRFSEFIEEVLLENISQKIVIFIDEIDSVLSLPFNADDFFAAIRAFYNSRADRPKFNQLTFVLLGVATPSDLIQNKHISTPFNIGRAIELKGFEIEEAQPLTNGLAIKSANPRAVMRQIIYWTKGQPFLTQKICRLILTSDQYIDLDTEATYVKDLVKCAIINNWESQDIPEHLRTIRDRLLWRSDRTSRLLELYRKVLTTCDVVAEGNNQEQMELRLSGLVINYQNRLISHNHIYREIFNLNWIDRALASLCPYSEKMSAWLASSKLDNSYLLYGEDLQLALEWTKDKALSGNDFQFLTASQNHDKISLRRELETTIEKFKKFEQKQNVKRKATQSEIQALDAEANRALELFDSHELESLILAMKVAQNLRSLIDEEATPESYPTFTPSYVLHTILSNIKERNCLKAHKQGVNVVKFSPDGSLIATGGGDGTIVLWELSGQKIVKWNCYKTQVNDLCFSPDGKSIASTGFLNGDVYLWNLNGKQIASFRGHQGSVWNVTFSADGQQVVTVGEDSTVRFWDRSGQQLEQWNTSHGRGRGISFSVDGRYVATNSEKGLVYLKSLIQGRRFDRWITHQDWVKNIIFSPDSQKLLTINQDLKLRVWDLCGKELAKFECYPHMITSACFSSDSQQIVVGDTSGKIIIWDISGQILFHLNGHEKTVRSLSFSPNRRLLVSGGSDNTLRFWDLADEDLAFKSASYEHDLDEYLPHPDETDLFADQNLDFLLAKGYEWLDDYLDINPEQLQRSDINVNQITSSSNIDQTLAATCPYSEKMSAWLTSGKLDDSYLLHGEDLLFSLEWAKDKSLSSNDFQFLTNSLKNNKSSYIENTGTSDIDSIEQISIESSKLLSELEIQIGNDTKRLESKTRFVHPINVESDENDETISFFEDNDLSEINRERNKINLNQEKLDTSVSSNMWLSLGVSLQEESRYEEAIVAYERVIESDPANFKAWFNKGKAFEFIGKYEDAYMSYVKVTEIDPDLKYCWYEIARILRHLNKYEEEIFVYDKLLDIDPKLPHPWIDRYNKVNENHPSTIWLYRSAALRRIGRFEESWVNRGTALRIRGRYDEALIAFNKAIEVNPRYYIAWYEKASIYAIQCNYDKIFENLEIAINLNTKEYCELIYLDPAFGFLYSDLRFQELISQYITAINVQHQANNYLDIGKHDYHFTNLDRYEGSCDLEFISNSGIDYTTLKDLLSSKNWLRADCETKFILLKLSGNEERGWLSGSDVTSLPCEDFQILDWLWSYYSGGRFGFSSQTLVWHSIGGSSNRADTSIETYYKFGTQVGWYKNKEWLSYSQMEFSLNSPFAHLPLLWRKKFEGYDGDWCGGSASIALKIAECKLQTKQNPEATVAKVSTKLFLSADNIDNNVVIGEIYIEDKLVRIYQGDITNLSVDVIVSSDINNLSMIGGVARRIRDIGGESIREEAKNVAPILSGQIAVTNAGILHAKKIFHTSVTTVDSLEKTILNCITRVKQKSYTSIAFPLLATGRGFPIDLAWQITLQKAVEAISQESQSLKEIVIVIYGKDLVESLDVISVLEKINREGWRSICLFSTRLKSVAVESDAPSKTS